MRHIVKNRKTGKIRPGPDESNRKLEASIHILQDSPGEQPPSISIFLSSLSNSHGGGFGRLGPNGTSPAADSGLEPAGLHPAAQSAQERQELTPELHSHECVEDGVEAAVQVTHSRGHRHGFPQRHLHSTLNVATGRLKRVHHEGDVVRRPAEEKHCDYSDDHPDRPLLLEALGAALQPTQDAGVAEDHDG